MEVSRGMIQVAGTTYRIVQRESDAYRAVRIQDEAIAGDFVCGSTLKVNPQQVDAVLMRRIARTALLFGRTNWTGAGTDLGSRRRASAEGRLATRPLPQPSG